MDTSKAEQDRIITIKSTGISLVFDHESDKYLINLGKRKEKKKKEKALLLFFALHQTYLSFFLSQNISCSSTHLNSLLSFSLLFLFLFFILYSFLQTVDSPGHVDFSSEVSAALRITDGALIVVDCVSGVCVQTETVTRQALQERIKPVLHINKLDRAITELTLSEEELYQKLFGIIAEMNGVLNSYDDSLLGDILLDPAKGNVSFGSGKQGWSFTLEQLAKKFAEKIGNKITKEKIMKCMWGDYFWDDKSNKIVRTRVVIDEKDGKTQRTLKRFFCKVALEPIYRIFKTIQSDDNEKIERMIKKLKLNISEDEKHVDKSKLTKMVLQRYLPAGDALLSMIVSHLPSPSEAQKYRVDTLYTGPLDDPSARGIRNCDPNGELVIFISKMVLAANKKNFYAFGRVFSGTARPGMRVKIMDSSYKPLQSSSTTTSEDGSTSTATSMIKKKKQDGLRFKDLSTIKVMMAKSAESVESIPAGNTIGIVGVDDSILKSGTIATSEDAFPISPLKFSVSPVVRVAVSAKHASDIAKVQSALKLLSKSDPLLLVKTSGEENIIGAAGELHLETSLNDLSEFLNGIEVHVSDPVVRYCETVTSTSNQVCLAKSPNNHNRLYGIVRPFEEGLIKDIEEEEGPPTARNLIDKYKWEPSKAKKLWKVTNTSSSSSSLASSSSPSINIICDATSGVSYLNEIRDNLVVGTEWAFSEGVLCGEPMRGVTFELTDAKLHADTVHRGGGQIIPPSRALTYASQMTASPRLMEPIFQVDILTDHESVSSIYGLLTKKNGYVYDEFPKENTPLYFVKAYLPVRESFGFTADLRKATGGRAFPQMTFSHYELVPGDPFEEGTLSNKICREVRKRKGMPENFPPLEKYLDKL